MGKCVNTRILFHCIAFWSLPKSWLSCWLHAIHLFSIPPLNKECCDKTFTTVLPQSPITFFSSKQIFVLISASLFWWCFGYYIHNCLHPSQKASVIYSTGLAWHPELLYCLSLNWKAQWHRMIVTKAARKYFCNSLYSSMHSEPRLNSWMEYLTKFSLTASLMSTHLNSSLPIVCIFYEDLNQQEATS